jgi:hypothetical protein
MTPNKTHEANALADELTGSPALVRAASQTSDERSGRKTLALLHASVANNHLKRGAELAEAGKVRLAAWNFAEAAQESSEAERIMRGCVE